MDGLAARSKDSDLVGGPLAAVVILARHLLLFDLHDLGAKEIDVLTPEPIDRQVAVDFA
jgi:hypothetical protein